MRNNAKVRTNQPETKISRSKQSINDASTIEYKNAKIAFCIHTKKCLKPNFFVKYVAQKLRPPVIYVMRMRGLLPWSC
jgi:hypothetical protein